MRSDKELGLQKETLVLASAATANVNAVRQETIKEIGTLTISIEVSIHHVTLLYIVLFVM